MTVKNIVWKEMQNYSMVGMVGKILVYTIIHTLYGDGKHELRGEVPYLGSAYFETLKEAQTEADRAFKVYVTGFLK